MKKSNKIRKKSEENRGMVLTIVGGDYGLVLLQGSVHISIYGRCVGSGMGWGNPSAAYAARFMYHICSLPTNLMHQIP